MSLVVPTFALSSKQTPSIDIVPPDPVIPGRIVWILDNGPRRRYDASEEIISVGVPVEKKSLKLSTSTISNT